MEVMTKGVEEGNFTQRGVVEALAILKQTANHTAIGVSPNLATGLDNFQHSPERQEGLETPKKVTKGRSMFDEGVTFKRVEIINPPRFSSKDSYSSVDTGFTTIPYSLLVSRKKNKCCIPNVEINWKVISQNIQFYLGPDSTVRPYTREVHLDSSIGPSTYLIPGRRRLPY